jgi:hypothetical protein
MGTNASSNPEAAEQGASPSSRRSNSSGNRPATQQNQSNPPTPTAADSGAGGVSASEALANLTRPYTMQDRTRTQPAFPDQFQPSVVPVSDDTNQSRGDVTRGRERQREAVEIPTPVRCINPASDVNSRLDTQVEVRVYPCNNNQSGGKKKFTTFTIKPEVSDRGM